MRFCTFHLLGEKRESGRAGLVEGSRVFELKGGKPLVQVIGEGRTPSKLEATGGGFPLDSVVLEAPVPRPGKILATIVNTQGMLGGGDAKMDRPRIDMKAPSSVVGSGETILAPLEGIRPEVELAVIIGRKASKAAKEEAREAIFGYTILNDVTAPSDSRTDAYEAYRRDKTTGEIRKMTLRGPLFRSKNHDTFCPMGPWIVTEELKDWKGLRMRTRFEGELVQDGSTSEYLFSPAEIASYVSQFLTLEPGDVLSCGSVGWTKALGTPDPTEFILPSRQGLLELEIEGIGKLSNPVKPEEGSR